MAIQVLTEEQSAALRQRMSFQAVDAVSPNPLKNISHNPHAIENYIRNLSPEDSQGIDEEHESER